MKRTTYAKLLIYLFTILCALSGCRKEPQYADSYKKVMIYYGAGYNNLSNDMKRNIFSELCKGELPSKNSDKAVLVFFHTTAKAYDYTTPNAPCLIRIYKEGGIAVADTLKRYAPDSESASADMFYEVMNDARNQCKSDSYGLVFSSHSTGWLPANTPKSGKGITPLSIGAQNIGSSNNRIEIDLKDFANAIPYKLEYIIFDSCLMGGIEVASELENKCDRIVFSPTEILSRGFDYTTLAKHLLLSPETNLIGVAKDYYDLINLSSSDRYATVSIVKCGQYQALSNVMSSIISSHRAELEDLQKNHRNKVQPYFYSTTPTVKCFYDMRDIVVKIGATEAELAKFDSALGAFLEYEAHTDFFFDLQLNDGTKTLVSGLSMYLPCESWPSMNEYYSSLKWNKEVGLINAD